jgi:D-lactate dehydrogenase
MGEEQQLYHNNSVDTNKMEVVLADHRLLSIPNVIVTPHNAFNTQEALERILEVCIKNILSWVAGTPQNTIGEQGKA